MGGNLVRDFFFFNELWFPDVASICFKKLLSFFLYMHFNSRRIKQVKPKQVFHLHQEQMIFSWKCLEKKILGRDLILNFSTHEPWTALILCFLWSQIYERKEEIKTQYVFSCVLPLGGKDHIEFLPRSQEKYASLKGNFWRDIWLSIYFLSTSWLSTTLSPADGLVPPFLNHQTCRPVLWEYPVDIYVNY